MQQEQEQSDCVIQLVFCFAMVVVLLIAIVRSNNTRRASNALQYVIDGVESVCSSDPVSDDNDDSSNDISDDFDVTCSDQ